MLGTSLTLSQYLARTSAEFAGIEMSAVERLAAEIHSAYEEGRFVFLCGNGGSGANASHICEDLAKSTLERADYSDPARKRLKIVSLTDNAAAILAWGNDEGFETVFVEQLKNLASADDMGQPRATADLGHHRLRRRQAPRPGSRIRSRSAQRHGPRRVDPSVALSLDPRRHPRADLLQGSPRASLAPLVGSPPQSRVMARRASRLVRPESALAVEMLLPDWLVLAPAALLGALVTHAPGDAFEHHLGASLAV
jgi:hypothetical protein